MKKASLRVYKSQNSTEESAVPVGAFTIPVGGSAVGVKQATGSVESLSGGGGGGTSGKVSLTAAGVNSLTYSAHNNKEVHAEAGVTELTMAGSNFQVGGSFVFGSFELFNYTGADLPLKLTGTLWSGGISNDGETTNDLSGAGTLLAIPHTMKGRVTFDEDGWVRAVLFGRDFGAVRLTGDQTVAGKKTFSTLPEVSADATTDNQLVRKSQHDTALIPKADVDSVSRVHNQAFTISKALCHPVNFTATTATGTDGTYTASASSEHSAPYLGRMVFDGNDATDWATQGVVSNFWARLQLPVKKIITRVIARGRNSGTERVTSWRIEASNDGTAWTTLHSSTTILGNTAQTFDFTNKTAYLYYRFFGVSGEATNPGLSRLEFHEDIPTAMIPTVTTSAAGLMSSTDKTKLDGVATGATANDTDANLKNRVNHTGTQAQSTITNLTTDLDLKAPLASPAFTGTPTGITKAHVGLSNVDNTADTAKPVSTAQQTALDAKQDDLTTAQVDALNKIQVTATRTIPNFTAATTAGTLGNYIVTRSSEFSATYAAWKACQASDVGGADNEWASLGQLTNLWIAIQLSVAKVVTSVRVRGRTGNEHPQAGWRLEGSNDGTNWTTLYTSATAMDTTLQTHQINNTTTYLHYRMFAPTGSGSNPGMRAFWLYENAYDFPSITV